MRHLVTSLTALTCAAACFAGCATSAPHRHRLAHKGASYRLSDDYTLTGHAGSVDDTSYYLERNDADAPPGLPLGAFAPGSADLTDEVDEQMFPDAPGTVEAALGYPGPLIQFFVVNANNTVVRDQPAEAGSYVRPLPAGERLVATVEGSWARIGANQFVPLAALQPISGVDERQQASLDIMVDDAARAAAP